MAFDVTVENVGTGPLDYNPFFSRLKTVDNREYTVAIIFNDLSPQLAYGVHQPGESSRGWVTFEVPQVVQLATLTYTVPAGNIRVTIDLR